jgi:hypothetical protein
MTTSSDYFPTDAAGLPAARSPEVIELAHGDLFDLRIAPVAKRLGDATVHMLAYNGSVPGPTCVCAPAPARACARVSFGVYPRRFRT